MLQAAEYAHECSKPLVKVCRICEILKPLSSFQFKVINVTLVMLSTVTNVMKD